MADAVTLFKRVLAPGWLVSLICLWRFGALVSPKSEVELTPHLKIGKNSVIGSYTKLKSSEGPIELGVGVSVATHCFIGSHKGGISIGDYSMLGPFVSVVANDYRYDRLDRPISLQDKTSKGIVIGNGVWLGSGVVVLDGSHIGDGAIVTPNSVVSGRVAENAVVQGNPAKQIFVRRA
jgi:acetyltransferase-like isoleucine patch superfamily enzyme